MRASCGAAALAQNLGVRRVGDVELNEDMAHERREWIAQRIGWVN